MHVLDPESEQSRVTQRAPTRLQRGARAGRGLRAVVPIDDVISPISLNFDSQQSKSNAPSPFRGSRSPYFTSSTRSPVVYSHPSPTMPSRARAPSSPPASPFNYLFSSSTLSLTLVQALTPLPPPPRKLKSNPTPLLFVPPLSPPLTAFTTTTGPTLPHYNPHSSLPKDVGADEERRRIARGLMLGLTAPRHVASPERHGRKAKDEKDSRLGESFLRLEPGSGKRRKDGGRGRRRRVRRARGVGEGGRRKAQWRELIAFVERCAMERDRHRGLVGKKEKTEERSLRSDVVCAVDRKSVV